jgi:two-component system cell cycle sensor histidine kinase/response regulator CckA
MPFGTNLSNLNRMSDVTTVLVVDDDPAMRMIVSLSLKLYGYVVLVAASGEEAVALAQQHQEIRVIILDVVMSGLAGIELATQLENSIPGAAILYCSGHPQSALSRYGVDLSSTNFLQKPCRAADLQEKIEELMMPT